MPKHCRIVVTDKCNLHCDYCLMLDKEISQSFKTSTIKEIVKQNYDIYLLTGGEPTCDMNTLFQTLSVIEESNPNAEIYIYSNGLASLDYYKSLSGCKCLKGLNIGRHNMEMYKYYEAINEIIPIRIYALYYEVNTRLEAFCRTHNIPLHILQWKQCKNENEDRYRLE